ncbi:hypothetical protein [Mammaliicoccus sciuri]|uniref:hypothetical protein n=1 Tax=Mammaliicoccus sciuri TaxID=1296 RepID=UPI00194E3342|nr:hypothetical protein [Mammaliicoccus sciuri]MBU6088000.1 hypothetical protein [Mammaliicoccus sciuri]MBW3108587.1 hypothetical protein [Mammaliicoccus sciuri]MEB6263111.1 hypothetical protein [Mammaliicoccus sciuri]WQK56741.1 hypothetical protein P3U46_07510 [Mammaliicoccus sciuri]
MAFNVASERRLAMFRRSILQDKANKQHRVVVCCKTEQTSNIDSLYLSRHAKQDKYSPAIYQD